MWLFHATTQIVQDTDCQRLFNTKEFVMVATKTAKDKAPDSYFALVLNFPLTPIRSKEHLKESQNFIDELLKKELDDGQELYLETLSELVAAYEDEYFPIKPPSDADMLAHLMDAKGISQTELYNGTSIAKSTISAILSGKRSFSKKVVVTLSKYFNVNVSVLTANLAE